MEYWVAYPYYYLLPNHRFKKKDLHGVFGILGLGCHKTNAVQGLLKSFNKEGGSKESVCSFLNSSHIYNLLFFTASGSNGDVAVSELIWSLDICSAIFSSVICCLQGCGLTQELILTEYGMNI